MEILALGLSLICLFYIFLIFAIRYWLRPSDEEHAASAKWTRTIARFAPGLKKLLNNRHGRGSGDMAY